MPTVELRRAFKFRLYPTRVQVAELDEWCRQLKFLWNLCHEQRLLALDRPRSERPRIDYYRQAREMTELVHADDRLERVVCCARQEILRDLDKAWQRFWKRVGGRPRFKGRNDDIRIYLSTTKHWTLDAHGRLVLAGAASSVGPIELRQDRPWPGDAKVSSCAIVRDVDEWYASFPLVFSREVERPKGGAIGINRGAIHVVADSAGRVVDSPRYYERSLDRLRLLSRRVSRKAKGSRNRRRAVIRLAKLHQKIRRQRAWFLHEQSAHYTRRYHMIGIEDWSTKKMVMRPQADERHHFSKTCRKQDCGQPVFKHRLCGPHYNEQKHIPKNRLRQSILDAGWYELGRQLAYKAEAAGGRVVTVNPGPMPTRSHKEPVIAGEAGISRTCSGCGAPLDVSASGHQEADCKICYYVNDGDVNAARNVLLRALRESRSMPITKSSPKATIKIKGRTKVRTATTAKPAVDACGGDPSARGPVEAGTSGCEAGHPERTVEPNER